jgi:hypothetical protein
MIAALAIMTTEAGASNSWSRKNNAWVTAAPLG